jgi:hypothetical protein
VDFAIDLIQKIPAGWPRWATLAAIIAAYFFFPISSRNWEDVRRRKRR